MKKIILISGEAQNGKDSCALILKEKLEGKTLILHYADFLKYMCATYLGWNGQKDEAGRTLIQHFGTELVREKYMKPNYWVERVCDTIQFLQDDFDYFIVADTRFKNEIFYPKAMFGDDKVVTIRVHRLNFDNGLTEDQKNHISEVQLKDFPHDAHIYCESGLYHLEIAVEDLIKSSDKLFK